MILYSWNVNGLRSVLKKGFGEWVATSGADVIALQETRLGEANAPVAELPFAHQYYHGAEKAGYSSTALLSDTEPVEVWHDLDASYDHPAEGRCQTAEFGEFFLVNVYVPNAQDELRRLAYRRQFNADLRAYLDSLRQSKPVVVCGDFNVAHQEIDLARPKPNRGKAGFSDEEREDFTALLGIGLVDIFRHRHPEEPNHYSWWSFRAGARQRNVGWRIDYFLVDERLVPQVRDTSICPGVHGSDHCPVRLDLDTR
ncbi:MAG: exodeoxyribonuclease III [Opitutales bacterium]